jgi:hypothetical protein
LREHGLASQSVDRSRGGIEHAIFGSVRMPRDRSKPIARIIKKTGKRLVSLRTDTKQGASNAVHINAQRGYFAGPRAGV